MAGSTPLADDASRAAAVLDFARSELFDRIFREGMDLVEDAAAYLDGPGRKDSKLLSRNAALTYAASSMRLTTRLMHIASWLLVQRGVRQGDMKAEDACQPRYRLDLGDETALLADLPQPKGPAPDISEQPAGMQGLIDRAQRLTDRVAHLDRRIYLGEGEAGDALHPVLSQHDRLKAAFGG